MSETRQASGRTGGIVPWNALRRRSAAAFLLAGAFLVGFAVRNGVVAFGGGFSPRTTGLLYLVMLLATVLAFVLLATAGLRSGERTVGLLLLGPPAIYVTTFVTGAMAGGEPPAWSTFAISAVQAGAHLLIGFGLRSGTLATGGAEPATA